MPRLPDVEGIKQYVDATALHTKITPIEITDESVLQLTAQTLRKHVKSQSFEKTKRMGKYVFLSASSKKWLVLHFGMTGTMNYNEGKHIGRPPISTDRQENIRRLYEDGVSINQIAGRLGVLPTAKLGTMSSKSRESDGRSAKRPFLFVCYKRAIAAQPIVRSPTD